MKTLVLTILTVLTLSFLPGSTEPEKKVEYYDNGNKKAEYFEQDGKQEGLWILWYEDGQKWAERYYKNGMLHGIAKAWYKNGNLQGETTYKNNNYDGPFTLYYENGNKQTEKFYKEGIQQGKETQWHPNGKIKSEGQYNDGNANGPFIIWDEKGNKTGSLEYKNNRIDGKCGKWNSDGVKISEKEYVNGILKEIPTAAGPYFGQKPPGLVPELLGPGLISTDNQEIHCTFSLDGKEVYFSMASPLYYGGFSTYFMKEEKGRWTAPQLVSFNQPNYNSISAFAPDGQRLFFNAGLPGNFDRPIIDIWCVERTPEGWGTPYHLGTTVNSPKWDTYPSVSNKGNLYFTSNRDGGIGGFDLYCSEFKNGQYTAPVNLGDTVNTKDNERHSCIAPDESYILFDSGGQEEGLGLYISFHRKDGTWTKPQNLGKEFNKFQVFFHVNITPNGKYIITSGAKDPNEQPYPNRDIYWTDAKIVEQFRPKELNP